MKSIIYFTIFLTISATNVVKIEDVHGSVRLLVIGSTGDSYAVAESQNSDTLHVLDSDNNVISTAEFDYIASVILNSLEELYILDYRRNEDFITIYKFVDSRLLLQASFTPSEYWVFLFDNDDNLFVNTVDGIGILRKNEQAIVTVTNLGGYHIINNATYAVDQAGNIYIGITVGDSVNSAAIIIEKDEINKPNPTSYFMNINAKWLYNMIAFGDSIYFGTGDSLIRIKDDNQYVLMSQDFTFPNDFTVIDSRFYFKYGRCVFKFLTLDYEVHDITGHNIKSCNSYQDNDGSGNLYIVDDSNDNSVAYFLRNNETVFNKLNVPNTLFFYGLAATQNGDLWILAQSLYVIPRGTVDAVKVSGLPRVAEPRPMKAKLTDEVLIGMDDGLYVVTV